MSCLGAVVEAGMPLPGRADDVVDAVFRVPAQHLAGKRVAGDEARRIAWAAFSALDRHRPAGDLFDGRDQFLDGRAVAGAEVDGDRLATLQQIIYGAHMGIGEIVDVDVVADAGAVAGVVVLAEDREEFAAPECGFDRKRDGVGFG